MELSSGPTTIATSTGVRGLASEHAAEPTDLGELSLAALRRYRRALAICHAAATQELIARYRKDPSLCLSALPLPPAVRTGGD